MSVTSSVSLGSRNQVFRDNYGTRSGINIIASSTLFFLKFILEMTASLCSVVGNNAKGTVLTTVTSRRRV